MKKPLSRYLNLAVALLIIITAMSGLGPRPASQARGDSDWSVRVCDSVLSRLEK